MRMSVIRVNQTLHGYSNGHTLLASSISLPGEVKRQMMVLSDMSGNTMQRGFEHYMTAYPIKETNLFALAKTWYAPEMKRPGCVWTHTLLFDFADVPNITNLSEIIALFRRPDGPILNSVEYEQPIAIDLNLQEYDNILDEGNFYHSHSRMIIKELYENSDKAVLIKTTSSSDFDQLFLAIWRQQWPRLRRNFSFCSGSINPRSIKGNLLDLQAVPTLFESVKSFENSFVILDTRALSEGDLLENKSWVQYAYEDLFNHSAVFQKFLNNFGSDVSISRASFKLLSETYSYFLNNRPSLQSCIEYLATSFQKSTDAITLKTVILSEGRKGTFKNLLPTYDEISILFHLAVTPYYPSFDYEKLNFRERFVDVFRLTNFDTVEVLKQIISTEPNVKGEEAITSLAQLLDQNEQLATLWSDKNLTSVLINLNPKLTLSRTFWKANERNQIEIINQLLRHDLGSSFWMDLIIILIEIKSNVDLTIFQQGGFKLANFILDFASKDVSSPLNKNWINYLKQYPDDVLSWLSNTENVYDPIVELIISFLDPNSSTVIKRGIEPWINYVNKIIDQRQTEIKIEVHAFLLALAFNLKKIDAQLLFIVSLESVYLTLMRDNLSYNLWSRIEVHTKPLSFWKDWDKCKKLINAVVDHSIINDWSIKQLANKVRNTELSARITSVYKKRK